MNDLEKKLQAPFPPNEIEWRIGRSGRKNNKVWATALAYVSNRAIMNRLDEVFGCGFWENQYKEWHNDSQICGISVYFQSVNKWVTKWDGADNTNFEGTKGGLSDSMKRAAVQWGIGRYLYNLEETFLSDGEISDSKQKGFNYAKGKDSQGEYTFYWKDLQLPNWALPEGTITEKIKNDLGGKELNAGEVLNNQTDKHKDEIMKIETVKGLTEYYNKLKPEEQELAIPFLADRKAELKEKK